MRSGPKPPLVGAALWVARRQVSVSCAAIKQDGATSLLSKCCGKPGNHRLPTEVRTLALSIVRERYTDFGPTFAAEKLMELPCCSVSHEDIAR